MADVVRQIDEIVTAISEGFRSETLKSKLLDLEARKAALSSQMTIPRLPELQPNMAEPYRARATALVEAVGDEQKRAGAEQA